MTALPTRPRRSEPSALPGWLLAAWAVTGIVLVLIAAWAIRRDRSAAKADWLSRLSLTADDRLALAERELQSWKADVHWLGKQDAVRGLLAAHAPGEASEKPAAAARRALEDAAQGEPGVALSVADLDGRVVATTEPRNDTRGMPIVRDAVARREPALARIPSESPDELSVEVAEPVLEDTGKPDGAVFLVADARRAFAWSFRRERSC